MSNGPTIEQVAKAVSETVQEQPQLARDMLGEVNRKLGTEYRDTRAIGRGIAHAVAEGDVIKSGAKSRPLYAKPAV